LPLVLLPLSLDFPCHRGKLRLVNREEEEGMSRKDYEVLAAVLALHAFGSDGPATDWDEGYEAARMDIARSLADVLHADNERFDAVRFYKAACIGQVPA
jgi:hypothetical protein